MNARKLFEPARIASLEARNRIAMPAIHLGRAVDGRPSTGLLDFYAARARGGAGVITVGVCDAGGPKRDRGAALMGVLSLAADDLVEPMAQLADRIKTHGALAGVQIAPFVGYNDPRWHPAADDLPSIVEAMGLAAARARAAGFDFVEMMLSGGSVLSHFVSRALNTYGIPGYSGTLESRLRLPVEIARAIRAAAGGDFPFGARIHCHEFLDGGYDESEASEIARALERVGLSFIDITGGGHRTLVPQITHQVRPLAFASLARRVADAVTVATMYGGQIRTADEASSALEAVGCDFANVGRALLADPDWALKAAEGRDEEIVPCMTCCHCFDDVFSKREVACALNPPRKSAIRAAARGGGGSGRALVVGAGPAGMQAALDLAAAGFETELLDRGDELGGRWRVAARLEGMRDLQRALDAMIGRVRRSSVSVTTGVEVTPEIARDRSADVLVLAAGAARRRRFEEPHGAVFAEDAIMDSRSLGRRTVVVGGGGVGLSVAIHLAKVGIDEVALVKRRGALGRGIGRSVRWTMVREAESFGVRVFEPATGIALAPGRISFTDEKSGSRETLEVDSIVLASGYEPQQSLAALFGGIAQRVVVVGDAREVGDIGTALADARRAALEIVG